MRKKLTDTMIRDALADMKPGAKRLEWRDTEQPGLQVRIAYRKAVFYWVGRNKATQKTTREELGHFPAMSTKTARDAARDQHSTARKGINTQKARHEVKRANEVGRMTVRDMRDGYIARREADGRPLSDSTVRFYNAELPRLLGDYFERPADALDGETLMTLVAEMKKARTVRTKHGATRKAGSAGSARIAVNCLIRLCKVYNVPCAAVALRDDKRLPTIGSRKGRVGTLEAQALFAWLVEYARCESNPASKVRSARMLAVAIATGWRIGTVEALEWTDIDFKARTIDLPKNKTNLEQTLPLSPAVASLLEPLKKKSGRVFDKQFLHPFTNELPIKCSPHDMRKAFASVVLQTPAAPPLAVKLLMGHTSGDVTVKHYLLTVPVADQVRALRATVDAVGAFIGGKVSHRATLRELDAKATERSAAKLDKRRKHDAAVRATARAVRRARFAA